jgi:hypothetical protein
LTLAKVLSVPHMKVTILEQTSGIQTLWRTYSIGVERVATQEMDEPCYNQIVEKHHYRRQGKRY